MVVSKNTQSQHRDKMPSNPETARSKNPTWEAHLSVAVTDFATNLSDEQRVAVHDYRSGALKCPPTHGDVMRLIAEINRRLPANVGSRCIGSRFLNVLQITQQYAALSDAVSGEAQRAISLSTWSLICVTLKVNH